MTFTEEKNARGRRKLKADVLHGYTFTLEHDGDNVWSWRYYFETSYIIGDEIEASDIEAAKQVATSQWSNWMHRIAKEHTDNLEKYGDE